MKLWQGLLAFVALMGMATLLVIKVHANVAIFTGPVGLFLGWLVRQPVEMRTPPAKPADPGNAGFITEGALRLLGVLGFATILVLAIGWCITAPGCKPAKPAAIPGDVVNLSADACQLIGDLVGLPDWVELLCKAESGQVVKIALPRADYHAMLARSHALDAGPGK